MSEDRSAVLSRYGITDRKELRVRPVQERDALWLLSEIPGLLSDRI
jgi:hypothetical protein